MGIWQARIFDYNMQSVQHMITSSRRMLSIVTAGGRTHPSQWTLRAGLALTAVQCQWSWYGRMRPPANRVCRVTPPGRPVVEGGQSSTPAWLVTLSPPGGAASSAAGNVGINQQLAQHCSFLLAASLIPLPWQRRSLAPSHAHISPCSRISPVMHRPRQCCSFL